MNLIEHLFINLNYSVENNNFSIFFEVLKQEIDCFKKEYKFKLKTIYIATNDLTTFNDQQLFLLLNMIKEFVSQSLVEYNFEIGYNSINSKQLAILKKFKVNRLIWKVRTFNNKLLSKLNKKFNSKKIINLIKISYLQGFTNFSIDLIDNIVEQTTKNITSDLQIALALKAPHISYESNNEIHNYQNKVIISKFLKQYHYENYEFFSFAKNPKNYSQQTLAYLKLKNWYGLGPNASSFFKNNNQVIIVNNSYKIPWTKKTAVLDEQFYFELLITQGLMLKKGILIEKNQLLEISNLWIPIIKLIEYNYLQLKNNYLKTTKKGWLLLNQVLIDIINNKD